MVWCEAIHWRGQKTVSLLKYSPRNNLLLPLVLLLAITQLRLNEYGYDKYKVFGHLFLGPHCSGADFIYLITWFFLFHYFTSARWATFAKYKYLSRSRKLPIVVKVRSIHHSSCSVPRVRQFVLLTSDACFEHVHVFKFFKYVSVVVLHNKYGLSTHDS